MSTPLTGALLGLTGAGGIVVVARYAPPMRSVRLVDRIAPYVATRRPARFADPLAATDVPFAAVRRVFGPVLAEAVSTLDRAVGGRASVRRRLDGLGSATSVEEFRLEQVLWGFVTMLGAATLVLVGGAARGAVDPVVAGAAALAGAVAGVLGRDYWLTRQLAQRERIMLAEFPVVADLLDNRPDWVKIPVAGIERILRVIHGSLGEELARLLADIRTGTQVSTAFDALAARTGVPSIARFAEGVAVAVDRGTPLVDVLRAQAADVREAGRRDLIETGGRKEIAMMVPVVFLILPVTVVFAFFPGYIGLHLAS